jgi:hypothetical protein
MKLWAEVQHVEVNSLFLLGWNAQSNGLDMSNALSVERNKIRKYFFIKDAG